MNLPGKPRTEEEQNYEHQSALVKSLLDKDYSVKQILDLTDVDGVDLDEETAKEILAYDGVGREASKRVFRRFYDPVKKTLSVVPRALYFPFSQIKDSDKKRKRNEETNYDVFGNIVSLGGNAVALFIELGLVLDAIFDGNVYPNSLAYLTTHLGIVAGNGIYELYQHEKKKLLEENLSELEQITNGDEE